MNYLSMALNYNKEICLLEDKLENSHDIQMEELKACHKQLVTSRYSVPGEFFSKLVAFYFNIPVRSPLKRQVREILEDASLYRCLTPFMSEIVIVQVTSQSEGMFSCVEVCVEHLSGGLQLIEERLYYILTEMNTFLLSNLHSLQETNLLTLIKSYHKIIAKCQTALSATQGVSISLEYAYLNRVLVDLINNCDTDVVSQTSELFGGIAQCTQDENVDISHTSIIVVIQLMRFLQQDTLLLDLFHVNRMNLSCPAPHIGVIYGLICASPCVFLFHKEICSVNPVFVSILFGIGKQLEKQALPHLQLFRCLHSCILSLRKSVTNPIHQRMLADSLGQESDLQQMIVSTVMKNWNSHIESVRHLTKDIFMEFLKLVSESFGNEIQTVCERYAKSFLLLDIKSTIKYKYLSLLSTYIQLPRWVVLDPLLPQTLPMVMDEGALATHVGEFWCRLVCQDSVLFSDIQPWIDSLIFCLSHVTAKHSRNIYDFCKKGIIGCHPEILQYIASRIPQNVQGYLFLILCLKQAQKQLPITQVTEILDRDKFTLCLIGSSSELTISILDLICLNQKSTSIMCGQELELVLKGFTLLVDTNSVSIRNNLISSLSTLLLQMERNAHKHLSNKHEDCTAIRHYSHFLSSLCSILFTLLNPTSSQGANYVVLSILYLTLKLFLNYPAIFPNDFAIMDYQLEVILASVKDTYEFNCKKSFDILILLSDRTKVWLGCSDNFTNLVDEVFSLMMSPVSVHSTSACFYVRLLLRLDPENLHAFLLSKVNYLSTLCITPLSQKIFSNLQQNEIHLKCLWSILQLLNLQLELSKEIWEPSKHCFYPLIRCIRGVLTEFSIQETDACGSFQTCLDLTITHCTRVLNVTGHIVCNSSPEGYLLEARDSQSTQYGNSRSALLCSWQSLKEISLLFSEMIESFFPTKPSLFYPSNLTTICEFYLNYLMEARHRGAFELTFVGFVKLCNCLWKSPLENVSSLPAKWLQEILNNLLNNEKQNTQLSLLSCATRRSAGLPYLILAVISNEPKHLNNKHLSITMDTLTSIVMKVVESPEGIIIKVHCLNILCALFKDNKLRDLMHRYVSTSIPLVITSVSSAHWPIRNASHLLFSSIISRVFGVKRTREEHAWQNKITTHNFFTRYPALWEIFTNTLSLSVQNSSSLQPDYSVFLLLTIFSRLYISISDTDSDQMNFLIPKLFKLSNSPCWKLREMSATSISSLLSSQNFSQTFPYFVENSVQSLHNPSHNVVHGFLLILNEFVHFQIFKLSMAESTTLFKFCTDIVPVSTRCIVNLCTVFRIISFLLENYRKPLFVLLEKEIRKLSRHLANFSQLITDNTSLKNKIFLQTQLHTFLTSTFAILNIQNLPSNNAIISTIFSLLDRSDIRPYLIQSIKDIALVLPSVIIFPLSKLFDLILESTFEEKDNLFCIILHMFGFNITHIAQELSQQKYSELQKTIKVVLDMIEESPTDSESLPDTIQYAGCLILSMYLTHQSLPNEFNTFIHLLFVVATSNQMSILFESMDSTLCALYHLLSFPILDTATMNQFWFLTFYILHQCKDSKLASLISTDSEVIERFPFRLHQNIATEILLKRLITLFNEEKVLSILLFIIQSVVLLELGNELEEQDGDKLFDETSLTHCNIPITTLLYISKLVVSIVSNSSNPELLETRIKSVLTNFEGQFESILLPGRLAWDRKHYLDQFIHSSLDHQEGSVARMFSIQNLQEYSVFNVCLI